MKSKDNMIAALNAKVKSLEVGEQELKEYIESTKVIIEDQDDEVIAERQKI